MDTIATPRRNAEAVNVLVCVCVCFTRPDKNGSARLHGYGTVPMSRKHPVELVIKDHKISYPIGITHLDAATASFPRGLKPTNTSDHQIHDAPPLQK